MDLSKKEVAVLDSGWTGDFVVCDTECTGFSAKKHAQLVQVSGVKCRFFESSPDGSVLLKPKIEIVEEFDQLINLGMAFSPTKKDPNRMVPVKLPKASREFFKDVWFEGKDKPGLTDEDLIGKPEWPEALKDFYDFVGKNSVMAFHNASYDLRMLQPYGGRIAQDYYHRPVVDTYLLAQMLFPDKKEKGFHKAESLAGYFGITDNNHHNGLNDARVEARIYFEFVKMMNEKGMLKPIFDFGGLADYESSERDYELKLDKPSTWSTPDGSKKRLYVDVIYQKPAGNEYASVWYDFVSCQWGQNTGKGTRGKRDCTNDELVKDFHEIGVELMRILGITHWNWVNLSLACNRGNARTYWNTSHKDDFNAASFSEGLLSADGELL